MFKFSCHPDGGESFEVIARSRAIAAWENAPGQPKGERRKIGEVTDGLSMVDMVDLAWFAADKAKLTGLDIRQWRDQVEVQLEKYEESDDLGPTSVTP